jgi:hypothetical protein
MSTEAETSALLGAVTKQRLGKTIKDWGLACAVLICKVCRSAIALQLLVVRKLWSINLVTNPNPVYSHTYRWQNNHKTDFSVPRWRRHCEWEGKNRIVHVNTDRIYTYESKRVALRSLEYRISTSSYQHINIVSPVFFRSRSKHCKSGTSCINLRVT